MKVKYPTLKQLTDGGVFSPSELALIAKIKEESLIKIPKSSFDLSRAYLNIKYPHRSRMLKHHYSKEELDLLTAMHQRISNIRSTLYTKTREEYLKNTYAAKAGNTLDLKAAQRIIHLIESSKDDGVWRPMLDAISAHEAIYILGYFEARNSYGRKFPAKVKLKNIIRGQKEVCKVV